MNSPATFQGHTHIWVAGAVPGDDGGIGGFEWDTQRERVDAWREEWEVNDGAISEVRQIALADLDLQGECTNDQITDALDARPDLWEPEI